REVAAGALLQLLARDEPLLDAKRRQARQRALVVPGAQVMARLHALDGVPIFVHVEDAAAHGVGVERIGPHLPARVERRCVHGVAHAAEALAPAEVVNSVHVAPLFYRRATPIRASRVTMPANFSSGQPMDCGGCSGKTM